MTNTLRICLTACIGLAACDSGTDGESGKPPLAPRDFAVSEMDEGAHLVWIDASDNEEEFIIERKAGDGTFEMLNALPFDTTVYHDATLETGVEYTYRVMARNGDGASSYTAERTITVED